MFRVYGGAFGLTKMEMVIFVEIRKVWKGYRNFTIIKKMWDKMIFSWWAQWTAKAQ